MLRRAKKVGGFFRETIQEFSEDNCTTMAAALAYYAMFSIPPMLLIVITVAGVVWGEAAVRGHIEDELVRILGEPGKDQILEMIRHAAQGEQGLWATAASVAILVFAATGLMFQLQVALNRVWHIELDPDTGGLKNFVFKRVLSFAMILAFAFLLLVSLVLTTVLSAVVDYLNEILPGKGSGYLALAADTLVMFVFITLLLAVLFKWFPDAIIEWRDVWMGAAVTALLFMVGKFALGWYLGTKNPDQYGTGGALVLVLMWVYFTSMILLYGAEFTQVCARRFGSRIVPEPGAVRITYRKEVEVRGETTATPVGPPHPPEGTEGTGGDGDAKRGRADAGRSG